MNKKKIIIGISLIVVLIVLFSTKLNPIRLLGSLYNANKIEESIGKIKVGDSIDYEINGYSNWQVVSIDKENNTLDVVSKENVEDITLETKDDYINALDTFQETANKYTDDKLAIKARCVTRADLSNFAFDEQFWNADIYNGSIAYTGGKYEYKGTDDESNKYQLLPYIRYHVSSDPSYLNIGDEYDVSIYGIDKWIVVEKPYSWYDNIVLIPLQTFEITIDGEDFIKSPNDYIQNIYNDIRNSDSNIIEVGNYMWNNGFDYLEYQDRVRNIFSSNASKYELLGTSFGVGYGENYAELGFNTYTVDYENEFFASNWITYRKSIPLTMGFRPIVTLKYSDKLVDGKAFNNKLQVGDNVNYTALEYQNWKVLSINEENNTVDIISGGIVKNILLYGEKDFESFEQILQNEVDKYKVGDNVISARIVEYADIPNLNKFDDKVNVKYWALDKKQYNKKSVDETSSPFTLNGYYDVSVMNYNEDTGSVERNWVSLYIMGGSSSGGASQYNGIGDLSFTAGLRPIITLKLDTVEKLDNDSKIDIIDSTKADDEKYNNEQQNNSNISITNDKNMLTNDSDGNATNAFDNNSNNNDDYNIGNISNINNFYNEYNNLYQSNGKLLKYIIVAIIVFNVAFLIQIILSVFIIKNIKPRKRKK